MILSMTGFAVQTSDVGQIRLQMECRSVNSRYLDLAFRLGDDVRRAEPSLREEIARHITRGKVECRLGVQTNGETAGALALNSGLLDQLEVAQRALGQRFPEAAGMSIGEILRWPGVVSDDSPDFEQLKPAIVALARNVLQELVETRRREGEKLAAVIHERVARMRDILAPLAQRIPELVAAYRERLVTRLKEAAAQLDEDRIGQEIVFFAQRIDVDEELSRLCSHLDEVERVLSSAGPAGKRLDFLMQELNREANTLASKSISSETSSAAMNLKVLIEQMREQVQNIE